MAFQFNPFAVWNIDNGVSVLSPNQFRQQPIKGAVVENEGSGGQQKDMLISSSVTASLIPATPVKIDPSSTSNIPHILPAGPADAIYGFICRDPQNASFTGGMMAPVASTKKVMTMQASVPINGGVPLMMTNDPYVTVAPWAAGSTMIGYAMTSALNIGDPIKVQIETPTAFFSSSSGTSGTYQ